jgi:DNA-binding transcriptional regulator YhcF (GntR family)
MISEIGTLTGVTHSPGGTVCVEDEVVVEKEQLTPSNGRYKYQRLRDRLREAISKRELNGKLPGERELARRFHANAKTINKALCDLMSEGLLVRHVGRGTFIREDAEAGETKRKTCRFLWLVSQSRDDGLFENAACVVGERGHRLERRPVVLDEAGDAPESVLTPSELRGVDGLVLSNIRPSAQLLADLHRRHLPVVMVNNYHTVIRTAMVLPDYSQGMFELCQQLVQRGHREIVLLVAGRLQPAGSVAEMGYRAAMQRYGLKARPAMNVGNDFDWHGVFNGENPVTALACVGANVAKGMNGHGGKDLAIAVLAEPGERVSSERVTLTYEISAQAVSRWAAELLISASPGEWPRTVVVPGRLRDSNS